VSKKKGRKKALKLYFSTRWKKKGLLLYLLKKGKHP